MLKEGVSVIVCCYNSASRITATLQHLAAQVTNNINCEIIIVDNASTDNTQQTVKGVWAKNAHTEIDLLIVNQPTPGLSFAREKGIAQARYNYMVFCDDDNWLATDYISTVFNLFNNHPKAAILGGFGTAVFEDESAKPNWFDTFHSSYAVSLQPGAEASVNSVYGAGMALRKPVIAEILSRHQLFLNDRKANNLLAGGDEEICLSAKLSGYEVLYSPALKFKHYLPVNRLNWAYLKKLHIGFAKSYVVINLYNKALNSTERNLPRFYWLKKALYYSGIYIKYWPKHRKAYEVKEGTPEELNHITWKTIAQSYFDTNFKTVDIYQKIVSLKPAS